MTFQRALYSVSKQVKALPTRQSVRQVVRDLTFVNELDLGRPDAGTYGYLARKQKRQFLGYVVVDAAREQLAAGQPQVIVPQISEEQRTTLRRAHSILHAVLRPLVEELSKISPGVAETTDPYASSRIQVPIASVDEELSNVDVATLRKEFVSTPAIAALLATPATVLQAANRQAGEVYKAMDLARARLEQAGVTQSPEDFVAYRRTRGLVTQPQLDLALVGVCVRAMLNNAAQLLFQAFLDDELVAVDKKNTITIAAQTQHAFGRGADVICQPNGAEMFCDVGQLIMFIGEEWRSLASIARLDLELGGEYGNSMRLGLRLLDEHMNPFPGLVR